MKRWFTPCTSGPFITIATSKDIQLDLHQEDQQGNRVDWCKCAYEALTTSQLNISVADVKCHHGNHLLFSLISSQSRYLVSLSKIPSLSLSSSDCCFSSFLDCCSFCQHVSTLISWKICSPRVGKSDNTVNTQSFWCCWNRRRSL